MMQDAPDDNRFRPTQPARAPVASAPASRPSASAEKNPSAPVPPAPGSGRTVPQAEILQRPRPAADVKPAAARPPALPERRPVAEVGKRQEAAKGGGQPSLAKAGQNVAVLSPDSFPPPPKPSPRVKDIVYARTTVNLRQRADAASTVLSQLKQGDAATVFARSGKWLLVSTRNGRGWVHSDHLLPPDPNAPRPSRDLLAAPIAGAAG